MEELEITDLFSPTEANDWSLHNKVPLEQNLGSKIGLMQHSHRDQYNTHWSSKRFVENPTQPDNVGETIRMSKVVSGRPSFPTDTLPVQRIQNRISKERKKERRWLMQNQMDDEGFDDRSSVVSHFSNFISSFPKFDVPKIKISPLLSNLPKKMMGNIKANPYWKIPLSSKPYHPPKFVYKKPTYRPPIHSHSAASSWKALVHPLQKPHPKNKGKEPEHPNNGIYFHPNPTQDIPKPTSMKMKNPAVYFEPKKFGTLYRDDLPPVLPDHTKKMHDEQPRNNVIKSTSKINHKPTYFGASYTSEKESSLSREPKVHYLPPTRYNSR